MHFTKVAKTVSTGAAAAADRVLQPQQIEVRRY